MGLEGEGEEMVVWGEIGMLRLMFGWNRMLVRRCGLVIGFFGEGLGMGLVFGVFEDVG